MLREVIVPGLKSSHNKSSINNFSGQLISAINLELKLIRSAMHKIGTLADVSSNGYLAEELLFAASDFVKDLVHLPTSLKPFSSALDRE